MHCAHDAADVTSEAQPWASYGYLCRSMTFSSSLSLTVTMISPCVSETSDEYGPVVRSLVLILGFVDKQDLLESAAVPWLDSAKRQDEGGIAQPDGGDEARANTLKHRRSDSCEDLFVSHYGSPRMSNIPTGSSLPTCLHTRLLLPVVLSPLRFVAA